MPHNASKCWHGSAGHTNLGTAEDGTVLPRAAGSVYVSNAAVSPHCRPSTGNVAAVGRSSRFVPSVMDGGRPEAVSRLGSNL